MDFVRHIKGKNLYFIGNKHNNAQTNYLNLNKHTQNIDIHINVSIYRYFQNHK